MLRELRIKNFTIIDDLSIQFETGLNILTGETGAGKSVIVDAIGILLGEKASQDMIKTGEKEAHIEAYFDNTDHPLLKELSIESDEGIILRRSINSQGKGRSYINDIASSIQTLSSVGRSLIDIHGQHEHQSLLKKESHLAFLDAFGGLNKDSNKLQVTGNELKDKKESENLLLVTPHSSPPSDPSLVTRYSLLFSEVVELRNKVTGMKQKIRERSQRIEFLRFQLNEIDSAQLKQDEKESLEEERAILLNLSKLKESSETAYMLLYEAEGSSLERLSAVASRIREIAQIDPDARELLATLEAAVPLLEDSAILLRGLKDKYDIDPHKLGEVDERFELIKRLEKKYGENVEGILGYGERAREELKSLETADEQLEAFDNELKARERELLSLAEALSKKRQSAAKHIETTVMAELRELGFQKAEFRIDMKRKDAVTATGLDDVEFLFSANPGESPKPLAKVVSGGELSRIMLALKCIKSRNEPSVTSDESKRKDKNRSPMTLIFDEVDAGIGGVTAQHVGKRLKDISGAYQVLCITHLPQIAALADYHMKVEKSMAKDTVKVAIEPLSDYKREEELARMLSGRITDGSLKHAKELLSTPKSKR